jgi:hypothetical protein
MYDDENETFEMMTSTLVKLKSEKKNQKLEFPQRRFTIHIHHCYFH